MSRMFIKPLQVFQLPVILRQIQDYEQNNSPYFRNIEQLIFNSEIDE